MWLQLTFLNFICLLQVRELCFGVPPVSQDNLSYLRRQYQGGETAAQQGAPRAASTSSFPSPSLVALKGPSQVSLLTQPTIPHFQDSWCSSLCSFQLNCTLAFSCPPCVQCSGVDTCCLVLLSTKRNDNSCIILGASTGSLAAAREEVSLTWPWAFGFCFKAYDFWRLTPIKSISSKAHLKENHHCFS